MKIVRIILVAVVAAVGVLLAGPAASASTSASTSVSGSVAAQPIQYVARNFYGAQSTTVIGTVACPSGTRMVSAGAGHAAISSITPVADYTAASASGYIQYTGDNAFMQVTVGCSPTSQIPGVTTRTITYPAAGAPAYHRGLVYCPDGTHAFGGGAYFKTQQGGYSPRGNAMFSNAVTADGTGWTFKGYTNSTTDRLVITTQCAPLPGSYVAQAHIPVTNAGGNLYGPCPSGYTLLSGGVYLSKSDGTEHNGTIFYSWPGSNSWFVGGASDGFPDAKLVALAQCIL